MNNPIFRLTAIFLVLALLLLTAAGCKKKETTSAEEDTFFPLLEDIKEMQDNKSTTTLTFAVPGWRDTKAASKVFDEISKKTESSLNIKLEFKHVNMVEAQESEYGPTYKVSRPFEKQETFDALIVQGDFSELVEKGLIMDLTDIIPPGLSSKLDAQELSQVRFNGRIMGIPSLLSYPERVCAVVQEDLLNECGMSEISNLNDYGSFLETVQAKKKDILPGAVPPNTNIFMPHYGYIHINGELVYRWDDPDVKLIPWEQTDAFKEAYRTIKYWVNNKLIDNNLNVVDQLLAGMLGSFVSDWGTAQAYVNAVGDARRLKIFPLYTDMPSSPAPLSAVVINKDSSHAAELLHFLDWIHSNQSNYDLFMYGIQGQNYDLAGDSVSLKYSIAEGMYYGWPGYTAFLNKAFERDFISLPDDFNELSRQMRESETNNVPTVGFKPMYGDKLRKLSAAREFQSQYMALFRFDDSFTIEKQIEAIVNSQKHAGVEELVAETQKQLDEWRSGRQ